MFSWGEVCGARPAVMGVVNVTPDSFSDGGRWLDPAAAVAHGLDLVDAGADLLDVGGASTRPGARPVDPDEEQRRVAPVVEGLVAATAVPVSIDTTRADVARAALDAGARVVNDVSGGRADPDLLPAVAGRGAGIVLMHMQGTPATMQDDPRYDDVVQEVGDFLTTRIAAARAAGITDGAIAVDPGIGFGKTLDHNLDLLAALGALADRLAPFPLLLGTSRKRCIGTVLAGVGDEAGEPAPDRREEGTLATTVWGIACGVRVVRVHDARAAAQAIRWCTRADRSVAA
jgi:dihydropteroate synthase